MSAVDQAITEQMAETLETLAEAMENVLLHHGKSMTAADQRSRAQLAADALVIVNAYQEAQAVRASDQPLIAAAPELLSVLTRIVEHRYDVDRGSSLDDEARAAIANATGEQA